MIKMVMASVAAVVLAPVAFAQESSASQESTSSTVEGTESTTDPRLEQIPEVCLNKTEAFGTDVDGAEAFDQTDQILANVKIGMSLYEYNVCETETLRMSSILWTVADELGQEVIYLERAGPRLSGCSSNRLVHRGTIEKVALFREETQVVGIGIQYVNTNVEVEKIGYGTSDRLIYEFEDDEVILGLYGEASDESITKLGFIVQNKTCTTELIEELKEIQSQPRIASFWSGTRPAKEEEDQTYFWIAVGVLAFLTIFTCCFVCCAIQYRKRQNRKIKEAGFQDNGQAELVKYTERVAPMRTAQGTTETVQQVESLDSDREVYTQRRIFDDPKGQVDIYTQRTIFMDPKGSARSSQHMSQATNIM